MVTCATASLILLVSFMPLIECFTITILSIDLILFCKYLSQYDIDNIILLEGLRMSQFKDVDPMQKTLANFVIWGDASLNSTSGSNLSGSEANDKGMYHPIDDRVTYLPDDGCHQHCALYDFVGPSDSDHLSYLGHKFYTTDSVALNHRNFRPLKDEEHPSQVCNSVQTFC